ncbi:hypothetical protein BO86DRAFT_317461, partial [Aspergillus japonicus CBS 114.51]
VFLVYQSSRNFDIYINYYTLNKITIKNYNLILLINKIFNWFLKAVVFTKLNIIYIFNSFILKRAKSSLLYLLYIIDSLNI